MKIGFKKLLFGIALAGLTVLALGVCLEVGLRLRSKVYIDRLAKGEIPSGIIPAPDGLYYTLKPHYTDGSIRFNSEGLNMPERSTAKAAGIFRVLIVGDSVTQGVGADRTEEAFPNQVDAILQARSGGRVECWNGGIGGYNIDQVFAYLKTASPRYEPDLVVYAFNFNDYWEPNYYYHGQAAAGPVAPTREREGLLDLLKKSHAILYLRDAYKTLHYQVRGYAPIYVDRKVEYPSWQRMGRVLAEMRDYAEAQGCTFAVVVFPPEQYLHTPDEDHAAGRDLERRLAEASIAYLDLVPVLRKHMNEKIYLEDGNHMNARGYRIAAEAIARWLVDSKAVPLP